MTRNDKIVRVIRQKITPRSYQFIANKPRQRRSYQAKKESGKYVQSSNVFVVNTTKPTR